MFNKILIANRGEIACRIIKTARRLGIETVAIYSTADKASLHVTLADSAYCVGAPPSTESYLNIKAIIDAACKAGVEAIHPGYGFLSENPDFAIACAKANITFIGPSVAAMKAMASKQLAKQQLEKTNVPLTPGYHGDDQSDSTLLQQAQRIGFPILLKAACGGGGKGMRAVVNEAEFFSALAGARREAKSSFADDTLIIEKLIQNPRHVEIQIMADNQGDIVHLFERDCSIQRRHQKIIEEAPAPNLTQSVRQGLADAAIAVARAIEYRGAGTVEFLVEDNKHFYFMEMNTRLQVEHPVTEMITGIDLVEWQLRIAANEPLPLKQTKIHQHGHAIECRIYAEDPVQNFMPSIGRIKFLKQPSNEGIRLDSGIGLGSEISMHYDPMMAKLISYGADRFQACQRMSLALRHFHVGGVKTNIPYLQSIIAHEHFIKAQLTTHFLNDNPLLPPKQDTQLATLFAASVDYLRIVAKTRLDPLLLDTFSWQMHLESYWFATYVVNEQQHQVTLHPINPSQVSLTIDNETLDAQIKLDHDKLVFDDGKRCLSVFVEYEKESLVFYLETGPITVKQFSWQPINNIAQGGNTQPTAPMPATVVAILKNKGDKIKAGETLIVLEAMKMEHTVVAPQDGLLIDIFYTIGAQVKEGAQLAAIE